MFHMDITFQAKSLFKSQKIISETLYKYKQFNIN